MAKESALAIMISQLKSTDLSLMIRMGSAMMPRVLDPFFKSLDEKQKKAMDKVLPPGKGMKVYLHLTGTKTPPIVVELAQPITMVTMSEKDVKLQNIKGVRLSIDDLLPLIEKRNLGNILKFLVQIKGQIPTMISIGMTFMPLLALGQSGLKDMFKKLTSKWQPLIDIFMVIAKKK